VPWLFMSLMEFFTGLEDEGEPAGCEAYALCQALPIQGYMSRPLCWNARHGKAPHALSAGRCWIAAAALEPTPFWFTKTRSREALGFTQIPVRAEPVEARRDLPLPSTLLRQLRFRQGGVSA